MSAGRQNQSGTVAKTDTWALEDESLNTTKAATAIPLFIGEAKTAVRWITPIYGQAMVKQSTKNTRKDK